MGRAKREVGELEIIEIAGRVSKRPKNGVTLQKKGDNQWQIYFGYDRHKKPVRVTISDKKRGEEIVKQFEKRWSNNERVEAQEIASFTSDAKSYALTQDLKAQGYSLQEAVDWFFAWMPARAHHITIAEAWVTYEDKLRKAGKSDRHIESMRDNYVGPKSAFYRQFKDVLVHMITPSMIEEFINSKAKAHKDEAKGWTRNTQGTHLAKITQFFNKLIKWEHLKVNPATSITRPKNKRGEDPDEKQFYANYDAIFSMLECIILKINKDTRRQYGLAIILVVWGGIRLEETVRLKWSDFTKSKDGRWQIAISEAQSKTFRRVNTLPENASTWVDQIVGLLEANYELRPDNPIMSFDDDPSKPINEKEIKQRQKRFRLSWKEWAKDNNDERYQDPKDVKQNGLRHACACYGIHALGSQSELMMLMGEQDAKVLEKNYRRFVTKEDADKLYSIPSLALSEAEQEETQDRERAYAKARQAVKDTYGVDLPKDIDSFVDDDGSTHYLRDFLPDGYQDDDDIL